MGRMHVADLEAGPFAGKAARTQGRKPALVGDFRKRIGLVHELAELRGTEELAHRRRRRLGIDQVMGHHGIDVDGTHAFPDRALHAQKADPVLVFHQLAHRAYPAVAEMVDIIDFPAAVLEFDHGADDLEDVFLAQDSERVLGLESQPGIHLDPADGRKVITLGIEEQGLEERLGGFQRRRFTGTHDPVNVDQCFFTVRIFVNGKGVADVGPDVDVIDGERRHFVDFGIVKNLDRLFGDFIAGLDIYFAGLFVDQIDRHVTADQVLRRNQLFFQAFLHELADQARRNLGAGLGDDAVGLGVDQILRQLHAAQTVAEKFGFPALFLGPCEDHFFVEVIEDVLGRQACDFFRRHGFTRLFAPGAKGFGFIAVQGHQQCRYRQLAAAVDADEHQVLGVEFEVQPGTAIGNDARREQEFSR